MLKLFEIVRKKSKQNKTKKKEKKKKKDKKMKKTKKKKKKFLTEIYQSNTPALTKIEKVFQYKMIE